VKITAALGTFFGIGYFIHRYESRLLDAAAPCFGWSGTTAKPDDWALSTEA
jgi:hypothetical protein